MKKKGKTKKAKTQKKTKQNMKESLLSLPLQRKRKI